MRTGIIRRMDDLGRVVIPKEIRNKLGIKEGAPLEIVLDKGGVCFVPYLANAAGRIEAVIGDLYPSDYDDKIQDELKNNIEELRKIAKSFERMGV